MVDAPFDEGNDGWDAQPGDNQPAMQMQMQGQDQSVDDAFADASFPASAAPMTILTASGA